MRDMKYWLITGLAILLANTHSFAGIIAKPIETNISWQDYSEKTIALASKQHKLILIYARAEWCEWCNKFNNNTLKDPAVVELISNKFIPIIFDIDKNKAAATNYSITELPTLLILDINKKIIKESHGYLNASQTISFLQQLANDNPQTGEPQTPTHLALENPNRKPILSKITRQLLTSEQWLFYSKQESESDNETYGFDPQTSYVSRFSTEYAIVLTQAGNQTAYAWLNTTMGNGIQLIDPIWGGMYSGSSNNDWAHPNYEKRLSVQSILIPLYLDAYTLTGKVQYYSAAESMTKYMLEFLTSPEGAFYHSQSAKMKSNQPDAAYYNLNDTLRRMEGVPEIDKTIYVDDNGLAINALAAMYMNSGNKMYLNHALKASNWIIQNFGTADGGFKHSLDKNEGIYLSDNLQMAQALITLYAATTEPQYLMRAQRALDYINNHFKNPSGEPGFVAFVPNNPTKETIYETIPADNASLAIVASLTSSYFSSEIYKEMAKSSLSYLISPNLVTKITPAIILVADDAISKPPLNITVIGKKDDPAAIQLYFAALKFPSFNITYHWYATANDSTNESSVKFPDLPKAAAFFCAGGRCSLPLYTPEEFKVISTKLTQQYKEVQQENLIANISTLLPKYSLMRLQQTFTDTLITRNWIYIILFFWMIGLLMAFTPCVFPLLLVLSTLLMSSSGIISHRRMLGLTLTYMLSLATTYAALGFIAATLGIYLQIYFQSPTVLILMSIMLGLLAFSLLGAYKIKLPPLLQHYFISFNSFSRSNTYLGAAVMGMLLTLVASPCAVAPLIGVLSIISQIGDPVLGVIALCMMGIGMSTPLLFIWVTRETLLPKVQAWQHQLEIILGLLMLAISIWIASRVIPHNFNMILWSGFFIVTAIFMGVLKSTTENTLGIFMKTASIMALIYGIALMVGTLLGNNNPYTPLSLSQNIAQPYNATTLGIFHSVNNESELKDSLNTAQNQKIPVLIDFYASWCVACNDIEKNIFTNAQVSSLMKNFRLIRIDLTSRDPDALAIAKKFDVIAPPAILFFDSHGNELNTQLYGDITADDFQITLKNILNMQ